MDKEINLAPVESSISGEVKMEIDYSATCDEKIPLFQKTALEGNLHKAIEELLTLEKETRTGGDMISTGRILVTIVELCKEAKEWALLNENITFLTKRRGQLKQAVVKMVQEVCTYIDALPTEQLKYELINTLRSVTEGKIYVEVERARLTYKLAKMKEASGDIQTAASIMQELQVETYGSMERREKVELILEQMRYCLANNDYIRTQIISKKINVKFFDSDGTHQLKLKFYKLMVEMDQHEGNYLNICRHFRAMLNTKGQVEETEDDKNKQHLFRCAVLYLLLSPFDNEQSDLLHRIMAEKTIESVPTYKALLLLFKNQELINWKSLCALYEGELKGVAGDSSSDKTGVFDTSEFGLKRWQTFKDRVVEHNIRIMAKYYTRVSLTRMTKLLDLSQQEVETYLCSMIAVSGGAVQGGRIDRQMGIVSFVSSKHPSDLAYNADKVMNLISSATHLINKEEMVHKHLMGGVSSVKGVTSSKIILEQEPMEVN